MGNQQDTVIIIQPGDWATAKVVWCRGGGSPNRRNPAEKIAAQTRFSRKATNRKKELFLKD
jgi:hypothetical protein